MEDKSDPKGEVEPTIEPGVGLQDIFVQPVEIQVVQPDPVVIEVITLEPVIIEGVKAAPQPDEGSQYQNQAGKFCGNCQGYSVNIRYTHYYPPDGGDNCWQWNEETQYCDSPTYSGIPWESAMFWGAACPYDWGIGTWIEVPYWGSVMCIDRGSMVCVQTVDGWLCDVDILAPSIGKIDGQVLQSVVFIPEK